MCDRGDSPEPLGWVRYNRIRLWCADIVRVAVDGQRVRYSTEHEGELAGHIVVGHEEEACTIADRIAAARVAYELEKERISAGEFAARATEFKGLQLENAKLRAALERHETGGDDVR